MFYLCGGRGKSEKENNWDKKKGERRKSMTNPNNKELTKGEVWWFLRLIEELCLTVLVAWEDLMKLKEHATKNHLTRPEQEECALRIWSCISVILTASANISKIIYGGGKLGIKKFKEKVNRWLPGQKEEEIKQLYEKLYNEKAESRKNILGKIFSKAISDSGVDLRERDERDLLEHFDAVLQLYLIKEGPKGVIHRAFGGATEEELRKKNELKKCLSYFSYSEDKIFLMGVSSLTEPVIELIKQLKDLAKVERERLEKEME